MTDSNYFYQSIISNLDAFKKGPEFKAEDTRRDIGARIRVYRDQHRLTQADLANRLDVSLRQFIRWERGESTPTRRGLKAMTDLGILK